MLFCIFGLLFFSLLLPSSFSTFCGGWPHWGYFPFSLLLGWNLWIAVLFLWRLLLFCYWCQPTMPYVYIQVLRSEVSKSRSPTPSKGKHKGSAVLGRFCSSWSHHVLFCILLSQSYASFVETIFYIVLYLFTSSWFPLLYLQFDGFWQMHISLPR